MSPSIKTLYTFPEPCFIENIALRSNGHLIFTTFKNGSVFGLDPTLANAKPYRVAYVPPGDRVTGIVETSSDVFAVSGGSKAGQFKFAKGSMGIWRLDLNANPQNVQAESPIEVTETEMLNGMANLPANPHILLSVDSCEGRIFRINVNTKQVDTVLQHDILRAAKGFPVPLGVNGAKVRDGYLYLTVSSPSLFLRVKINDHGDVQGEIEVLSRGQDGSSAAGYDDFAFDGQGSAYITAHPGSIDKIDSQGKLSVFLEHYSGSLLEEPTSCIVSHDGKWLYVTCAGKLGEFRGSIVQIGLDDHFSIDQQYEF